ncbi:MAG: restriction endonuclease subunit S [Pseudomonadota bacterium]
MSKVLGDIAKLQGGYAYKSRDLGLVGLPVVKIGDVTGGGSISYGTMQKIPLPIAAETKRFATSAGDTLISMTGANVGKVARVGDDDPEARINQRVGRFVPIPEAGYCKDYIHYVVSSKPAYQFFANAAYGSAQPNISGALIEALPVPGIEPGTANKIGEMLASLDDKIELNRRMNETLEEMARALFRDWFVDFGPTRRQMAIKEEGLATDRAAIMGHAFPPEKATTLAPLFPQKLGDDGLPYGWRKTSLKSLGNVVTGKTPSTKKPEYYGADIPFLKIPDMHGKSYVLKTASMLSALGASSQTKKTVPAGSVSVSCIATPGLVVLNHRDAQTNQQINTVVPNNPSHQYFTFWSCREIASEVMIGGSGGSVFHNMNKTTFENLEVAFPGNDGAALFGKVVEPLHQKILANEQENQTLAALRDLLLPKLMSGEIRLIESNIEHV